MSNVQEFLSLIDYYRILMNMEVCDVRVIETVIQMIMSYVPINIESKLKSTSRN